jgi:hypothetical protein
MCNTARGVVGDGLVRFSAFSQHDPSQPAVSSRKPVAGAQTDHSVVEFATVGEQLRWLR